MPNNPSRRSLLQVLGLFGASAAAGTVLSPAGAHAAEAGNPESGRQPDPHAPRFTLAVIPDTQYLFDGDRGDPAPLRAAFQHLVTARAEKNIVFTAHLGDVVENAAAAELAQAGKVFEILDGHRMPYSVLAGNHDINAATDDQRGASPYLDVFGPGRYRKMSTFRGASADGYNTYHVFTASGREWLLLALDWRPSAGTLAWAREVLGAHPGLPAILTTHDLAWADGNGQARLSGHGQRLWDSLIKEHDQIFLTLNGHFWPSGRTVLRNTAGHDVHVHITNYQDRYYGGSGMVRLYHFDLARNTIDVETFSPWILDKDPSQRNDLEQQEVELTEPANRFSMAIDFTERFAGFAPVPPREPRPASQMVVPGTVAYWRFDEVGPDGTPVPEGAQVADLSGRGNHLTRITLPGSDQTAMRSSVEHHPDQPAHGSIFLNGKKQPARGAYLRTADDAPLNRLTFASGYTIEAFVKLPADVRATNHAWMSLVCRMGSGRDAGKTAGDPAEPLVALSLSDGMALQWAVFPLNQGGISTNWGHEMRAGEWFHVAVVNDGRTTTMYVNGAKLLRNPSTSANGLATNNEPWLVGAYHYDRIIEQGFYGWLGDIRIVDRPLPVRHFMRA
ncbi:LamG-like jellyroll fold domain-containing protein [Micromonospora sp. NPDC047730]|uniref:LamG-like jellyroll fold domain-containing protein n=1 Tax=Micromonospora sp. NPDC047730 TaxID=3364253 RepID=UPI0037182637